MTTSALYFPYIEVPSSEWTTRAILYWDRLTSIVPMDHDQDRNLLRPRMRELMDANLIEPVIPGAILWKAERFAAQFIEAVEARHRGRRLTYRLGVPLTTRIHVEKLDQISEFLVARGLAIDRHNGWFDVDTTVAHEFMAYLAAVLGKCVKAAPITDNLRCAKALGYVPPSKTVDSELHREARGRLLQHLLPIPYQEPPIDQLVRFKEKHGLLLPALRQKIEDHCAVIASIPDPAARLAASRLAAQELDERTEEIAAAMRVSFGDVAFSAITALSGAGLSLATDQGLIGFAGAALSFAGPAQQAIASIQPDSPRSKAARHPLAYLAHARKSFSGR